MKKTILVMTAIAGVVSIALFACKVKTRTEGEAETISADSLVKRGSYLVNAIGCDDCHSPKTFGPHGPEVIEELRFSGYPADRPFQKADTNALKSWVLFGPDLTSFAGPWGMSFAANISSDETGIGSWTEEQFIRAIREGKNKGLAEGRTLLPPMPWFVYRNLNDTDLKAIFAYLKTSKPVSNVVPAPKSPKEL